MRAYLNMRMKQIDLFAETVPERRFLMHIAQNKKDLKYIGSHKETRHGEITEYRIILRVE